MEEREFSEAEINTVRWIEKILTPIIVIGLVALFGGYTGVKQALGEQRVQLDNMSTMREGTKQEVETIKRKQESILDGQHELREEVIEMKTNQTHILKELEEAKDERKVLIDLLRTR